MRMYRWRATIQTENPDRLRRIKKNLKKSKRVPKTDMTYSLEKSWVQLGCVIDSKWFAERDKKRLSRRQSKQ